MRDVITLRRVEQSRAVSLALPCLAWRVLLVHKTSANPALIRSLSAARLGSGRWSGVVVSHRLTRTQLRLDLIRTQLAHVQDLLTRLLT